MYDTDDFYCYYDRRAKRDLFKSKIPLWKDLFKLGVCFRLGPRRLFTIDLNLFNIIKYDFCLSSFYPAYFIKLLLKHKRFFKFTFKNFSISFSYLANMHTGIFMCSAIELKRRDCKIDKKYISYICFSILGCQLEFDYEKPLTKKS